jgi:hypothetical protein
LERQGWKGQQLNDLLIRLSYPHPVAETSSEEASVARTLWKVREWDRDALAEAAITSESPDLSFGHRVQVIAANLKLVPDVPPPRAEVTKMEMLASLGGPVELGRLVLVDSDEIALGKDTVRAVVPEAADLQSLARTFTAGRVPEIVAVLGTLRVPKVGAAEFRSRVIADFAAIWRHLNTQARLELLAWLWAKDAALPANDPALDTVLVGDGAGTWVSPAMVIAPSWASPTPPNVPITSIARTVDVPQRALRLWDQWCGLRDLDAVVSHVVRKTGELPAKQWPQAANRLVHWVAETATRRGSEATGAALSNLPWLLAKKGGERGFKRSREVLDHPGAEVLQHEFWVVCEKIPASLIPWCRQSCKTA